MLCQGLENVKINVAACLLSRKRMRLKTLLKKTSSIIDFFFNGLSSSAFLF